VAEERYWEVHAIQGECSRWSYKELAIFLIQHREILKMVINLIIWRENVGDCRDTY